MSEKGGPPRMREITVDSDLYTTLLLGVLFILCALFLLQDIHQFFWGRAIGPKQVQYNFWSIWNRVFEAIAACYCFIFAFKYPKKSVRIACLLLGSRLAGFLLLSLVRVPTTVFHVATVSGAVISQVALLILCVAIAQWFKSVIRWSSESAPSRN